jgi:hypothetical protein
MYKKLLPLVGALLFVQSAFGQVTYKSVVTSDGFMGMGAFKSTTKTLLVDHAQRTETNLKFTGKFMKHFSPKGAEVSVVRLDKKLVWSWSLDTKKKKYTEQTFAEIKKMMEEGIANAGQPMPEQDTDYESEYTWSKPKVKVEDLKENKTINEFNCNHYLASVATVGTHKETDVKDTMLFTSDIWNSKGVKNSMNQVYAFNKKYMKAIGVDIPENAGIAMITGMYKNQMETLEEEIQKLEGYPIINDMKLIITKNAMPEEKEAKEEKVTLKDIQNDFGGLLSKKIMKDVTKKKKKEKESSVIELFHIKTEMIGIFSSGIEGSKFEVKKGYKLKNN